MAAALPFRLSQGALLLRGEPLAPLTSFKIGGPAELLLLPASEGDVRRGVEHAAASGTPWRVIGSGTNILVPDAGLPGLTIKLWKRFDDIAVAGATLRARAGATMWAAASAAADAGLSGLEFGCGIPGTVGGAVFMNAGDREWEIRDVLLAAAVLGRDGVVRSRAAADLGLRYRGSALHEDGGVVLAAEFGLRKGDTETIVGEMNRRLEERRRRQPLDEPNCGSVFRNPHGDFAGRLIEEAGCKGLGRGGVRVSELHANFMVNIGGGRAADVLALIGEVRRRVSAKFGVELELELRVLN